MKTEDEVLEFWKENKIFDKLRKKNKGKKKWSFLDGPITANNPMGVHHAWGRTYKDLFQRFKAMQGYDQRFQNGFDCQGLWVEREEEKDLGLKDKRDIEKFGILNFVNACKKRVEKFSKIQTEQSIRLGQWMDCEGMGSEQMKRDWQRFDFAVETQETFDKVEEAIGKFFLQHTKAELLQGVLTTRIMLRPLSTMRDVLEDPQLRATGFWEEVGHAELGEAITYPGAFVKVSETPVGVRLRAPLIGEHNAPVYEGELGLTRQELLVLMQGKVV